MADFFSDIPGWAKGAIAVLLIGGSNGAQYFGLAAPATEAASVTKEDRDWCRTELSKTQDKLEKCWQECSR
jgi:hypothetical protein